MSSDERIYVQSNAPDIADRCATLGLRVEVDGGWCRLEGVEGDGRAREISTQLDAPVVFWSIHTVVDQIWIICFEDGKDTRTLRYSADEGWAEKHGKARPFEHAALKAWLKRSPLSARNDGYDILECFLGRDRPPVTEIVEPGANLEFFLPTPLVKEAQEVARARACSLSDVMFAAWELGKHAVLAQHGVVPDFPMLGNEVVLREDPALAAAAPPFAPAAARTMDPLPTSDEKICCKIAAPTSMHAEMRAMLMALDRPGSWLLWKAYLAARDRLAP